MSIDDLILLPHDQLDYKRLAAELLLELATQEDEPYIATSALAELAVRRVPETRAAAAAILDKKPWDRYLYAVAIMTLCKVDREQATRKMAQLIEDTSSTEGHHASMPRSRLVLGGEQTRARDAKPTGGLEMAAGANCAGNLSCW